jgi:tetratricopeptide (TPR) repeat protein
LWAHFNLADTYERKNQIDQARYHLEKSIGQDSKKATHLLLEARLQYREKDFSGALEKLQQTERLGKDNLEVLFEAYFLLGKIYDRTGEETKAFDSFAKMNKISAGRVDGKRINPSRFLDEVVQLEKIFTKDWLGTWTDISLTDRAGKSPVFLVGFPRSGTTLLDQVLSTHPKIVVIEEIPTIRKLRNKLAKNEAGFPDSLATLGENNIYELRQEYFQSIKRFVPYELVDGVIIDKLPINITQVGLINRIFPDAKFILALRHPYDVCLSCFMQNFGLNDAMANFHNLKDTARLYSAVMKLWQKYVSVLDINFHAIKYENLVEDFQSEVEGLLSFLNLPWDDELLGYYKHVDKRTSVRTPSYQDISSPVFSRAKYRWKRYERYFVDVKEVLAPPLEYFGYTLE